LLCLSDSDVIARSEFILILQRRTAKIVRFGHKDSLYSYNFCTFHNFFQKNTMTHITDEPDFSLIGSANSIQLKVNKKLKNQKAKKRAARALCTPGHLTDADPDNARLSQWRASCAMTI
jgi:hypothetical protein